MIEKLHNVLGQNLDGWQLAVGHYVYHDHGLWALTPVLREDGKMFVCVDEEVAKKAERMMSGDRRTAVAKRPFLWNVAEKKGFFIDDVALSEFTLSEGGRTHVPVVTKDDFERLEAEGKLHLDWFPRSYVLNAPGSP